MKDWAKYQTGGTKEYIYNFGQEICWNQVTKRRWNDNIGGAGDGRKDVWVCPMAGFGVSGVKVQDSATID